MPTAVHSAKQPTATMIDNTYNVVAGLLHWPYKRNVTDWQ